MYSISFICVGMKRSEQSSRALRAYHRMGCAKIKTFRAMPASAAPRVGLCVVLLVAALASYTAAQAIPANWSQRVAGTSPFLAQMTMTFVVRGECPGPRGIALFMCAVDVLRFVPKLRAESLSHFDLRVLTLAAQRATCWFPTLSMCPTWPRVRRSSSLSPLR